MKLLIGFLVAFSLVAQAQVGFPVLVQNELTIARSARATTRDAVFDRESDPLDLSYTSPGSATIAGVVGRTSSFIPANLALIDYVPYGFQAKIKSFVVSADGPCRVTGYIRKSGMAATLPKVSSYINLTFQAGGGVFVIPVDGTIHSGAKIVLTKIESSTASVPTVDFYTSGVIISENKNYTAPLIYASLGNSISWGTLGANTLSQPNTGNTHFSDRTNTTLRNEGIDIRLAKRGFGGSIITNWVKGIDEGAYENQDFDLITLLLATNEAVLGPASTVDATTGMDFTQALEYVLDYLFMRNPNACIVLLGPPPSTTATRVTNLPSYRTALLATKNNSKYAGKDLLYADLSTNIPMPTGANDVNFTETAANSQIHPRGDTGHLKMWQTIMPVLRTSQFYQKYKNLLKPLAP